MLEKILLRISKFVENYILKDSYRMCIYKIAKKLFKKMECKFILKLYLTLIWNV